MRGTVGSFLIIILLGSTSAWGQAGGADGPQFGYPTAALPDASTAQPISRLPPTEDAAAGAYPSQPNTSPNGSLPSPVTGSSSTTTPLSDQDLANGKLSNRAGIVWSVQVDALGLYRSTFGTNVFLGQTSLGGTGPAIDTLNANDGSFGIQPGLRLALSMRIDEQFSYEILYFGLQNWSASQSIQADPTAGTLATSPYTQSDKLIGGFDQGLGYTYTSQLQNAEFNGRRLFTNGPWTAGALVGFRYFQWTETLSLSGTDRFYGLTENLNSHTNNYLVGLQAGGDLRRDWKRFSLGMTGKAGLYANFMQMSQSNLNSTGIAGLPGTGFVSLNSDTRSTGAAVVLDFSAVATYHVTEHFALRGGYQLLYVGGLALAPSQLAGPAHDGGVLLQGPTAGMEFTW
jgi:hypothetical protein